jgi:cation diffusion facilitator family transporter
MLALIALLIGYEAVMRLTAPVVIYFREAIGLAVLGLAVNLVSAWLLFDRDEHHAHHHGHHHDHHHHGHDTNLRAAYMHVLADALTSVLAIVALTCALWFGWLWMDPLMALVGVCVILSWSFGLIRAAGAVLLDMVPDRCLAASVRKRLEVDDDRVCDLHLWRLGPGHTGVIAAVVSERPQTPGAYKMRLEGIAGLSHVTVEVHRCPDHARKAASRLIAAAKAHLLYAAGVRGPPCPSTPIPSAASPISPASRLPRTRSSGSRGSSTPSSPSSSSCRKSRSKVSSRWFR